MSKNERKKKGESFVCVDDNCDWLYYQCHEYHLPTIKKKDKALEIIKTKRVDVNMIFENCSLPEYNEKYKSKSKRLLSEEYNLLREVML